MTIKAMHDGTRRLFFAPKQPKELLAALESPKGGFVPSRFPFHLGDQALLAIELDDVAGALEVPVTVVGRRAPKGASGALVPGIVARLADPGDPRVTRLRDAVSGRKERVRAGVGRNERLYFTRCPPRAH